MKKFLFLAILAVATSTILTSCVESSSKFKALQAQCDSLMAAKADQDKEIDEVFAILNGIEDGLASIRESENIITMQTNADGVNVTASKKDQIMNDIDVIQQAISTYQQQIEKLKQDNKYQSAQYKKRLASLQKQIAEQSATIEALQKTIAEKDVIISDQKQQISNLGNKVSNLETDVRNLSNESQMLKSQVANQDEEMNTVYYVVGTKAELKDAGIVQGGFLSKLQVTGNVNKDNFVKIDLRNITEINTNAKKARILSKHPSDSYNLVEEGGETLVQISDPQKFWDQTKYLVIQVW